MPARSTRATIATVLIAAAFGATAAGQSPAIAAYPTYRAAVAEYVKTRDIARAVVPLRRWTSEEFDASVKATLAAKIPAELEAAAIFHLEIGVALVGVSANVAAGHVRFGSDLLDRWVATQPALSPSAVEEQKRFRSMWFGVAGSAFAAIKDLGHARPLVNKAAGILPKSARLQTLIGTLKEFEALQFNPEDGVNLNQRERLERERFVRLHLAEQDYLAALRYDKDYALAHIRLGRVLHLAGKLREARASLDRGRALAKEPQAIYLAALFMGALQQDEKDVDGARRSLEQAVTIAPNSQPAVVALAHLEVMTGRPDRAHMLARGIAEASVDSEPWWAFHNGGLDLSGLRWLRDRGLK